MKRYSWKNWTINEIRDFFERKIANHWEISPSHVHWIAIREIAKDFITDRDNNLIEVDKVIVEYEFTGFHLNLPNYVADILINNKDIMMLRVDYDSYYNLFDFGKFEHEKGLSKIV